MRSALAVFALQSICRCFFRLLACENNLPISLMNIVTASSVSFWQSLMTWATIRAWRRLALKSLASQAGVALPSRIIWSHRPDDTRACSSGSISSRRRKAIRSVSPTRFDAAGASGAERSQ
ncbi:hypothetical protein DOU54_26190 [Agrobacterium sp. MS2]|nr:hypothetical protein DOU54_26190 [Agrobacterium sp. MS2]